MRTRAKFMSLAVTTLAMVITAFPASAANYTLTQVQAHNTAADCWTIVEGKVYDLSAFVSQHEGGKAVIEKMCGIDSTAAYSSAPPSHSVAYLSQHGKLLGALGTAAAPSTSPSASASQSASPKPSAKPAAKKVTIKCLNLKTKKVTKVTAVKPVCPKGSKLVK